MDTGVDPDTVTVGERFRSALRVTVPPGYRAEFGEIAAGDTVEAASPVQVLEQADGSIAALFELAAWMTGDSLEASAPVRVIDPDGQMTEHDLPLALPVVVSVLPAGDEEVAPRPVKGLIVPPASAPPFPWWWLLLAAAVVAALIYAWSRSRRNRTGVPEDPREWAVRELDALLADEGASEPIELYRRGSWVLRSYLARAAPSMGADLTTGELVNRARVERLGNGVERQLAFILEDADRAKFSADHPATVGAARAVLQATRALVLVYPPGAGGRDSQSGRAA